MSIDAWNGGREITRLEFCIAKSPDAVGIEVKPVGCALQASTTSLKLGYR